MITNQYIGSDGRKIVVEEVITNMRSLPKFYQGMVQVLPSDDIYRFVEGGCDDLYSAIPSYMSKLYHKAYKIDHLAVDGINRVGNVTKENGLFLIFDTRLTSLYEHISPKDVLMACNMIAKVLSE